MVLKDMSDDQMRTPSEVGLNSLVWYLWHVSRWNDVATRVVTPKSEQMLDEQWLQRMNVARRDGGTGMTPDEYTTFNAEVDPAGVRAYWGAVGERVQQVGRSVPSDEWSKTFDTSLETVRRWRLDTRVGLRLTQRAPGTLAADIEPFLRQIADRPKLVAERRQQLEWWAGAPRPAPSSRHHPGRCQGRSKIRPPWRRKTRPLGSWVEWRNAAVRRGRQDAGVAAGWRAFLLCSRR